jgi:hypothetical protein
MPETHAFSCSIDMHSRSRRKKARYGPGFGKFVNLPLRKVYACGDRFRLPEQNAHRSRSARITKHQRLVYIRSLLDKVLEISTVQCVGIIRALNNARCMR